MPSTLPHVIADVPAPQALETAGDAVADGAAETGKAEKRGLPALRSSPMRIKRMASLADWPTLFRASFMRESELGTGFVLAPVFLLSGAAIYFALPIEPAIYNIPVAIVVLAVLRFCLGEAAMMPKALIGALLMIVIGMGVGQWHTQLRSTMVTGSAVSATITGRIVSIEPRADGSARYTLDLLETERPTLKYAPQRIRLTARKPVDDAGIGSGLKGYARLLPPSGPVRPGGYDFAFNAYFDAIGANGFFLGQPDLVVVPPAAGPLASGPRRIEALRLALWKRIEAVHGGEAGAVSAALVTGHKGAISDATNDALRQSGLAHILSISGLHMALVAGTVMAFLRAMFALMPDWASHRATKKHAAIIGFAAISIYLFLAGASVATQRSFIMLAVMLGALMGDRAAITMRNLAIAAFAVILIAPHEVSGPSFQMSFAATIALVGAYQWWARRPNKRGGVQGNKTVAGQFARKGFTFFAGLAMTSLIAGAASGFFGVWHFQRVATLGLLGNLLAMPLVSLITMPSAIAGVLLIPVGLDGFAFSLMAVSVDWVITSAQWVAQHSPTGVTGAMALPTFILGTAGLIVLCACQTSLRWIGLVFLVCGFISGANTKRPNLVVSEDGGQVAIIFHGVHLAANRARPNGFTYEQWQTAYRADTVQKPGKVETLEFRRNETRGMEDNRFTCDAEGRCIGTINAERDAMARVLVLAKPLETRANPCAAADLIIEAYSPGQIRCGAQTRIITAKDLALRGSAEVFVSLGQPTGPPDISVRHAIGTSMRPWHAHRMFSRPARNLPPIERRKKSEPAKASGQ